MNVTIFQENLPSSSSSSFSSSKSSLKTKKNRSRILDRNKKNIQVTMQWLLDTYTINKDLAENHPTSLSKAVVFNDYLMFCRNNDISPTTRAVFGKIVKLTFPEVSYCRKGTRKAAKHHYKYLISKNETTTTTTTTKTTLKNNDTTSSFKNELKNISSSPLSPLSINNNVKYENNNHFEEILIPTYNVKKSTTIPSLVHWGVDINYSKHDNNNNNELQYNLNEEPLLSFNVINTTKVSPEQSGSYLNDLFYSPNYGKEYLDEDIEIQQYLAMAGINNLTDVRCVPSATFTYENDSDSANEIIQQQKQQQQQQQNDHYQEQQNYINSYLNTTTTNNDNNDNNDDDSYFFKGYAWYYDQVLMAIQNSQLNEIEGLTMNFWKEYSHAVSNPKKQIIDKIIQMDRLHFQIITDILSHYSDIQYTCAMLLNTANIFSLSIEKATYSILPWQLYHIKITEVQAFALTLKKRAQFLMSSYM